MPQPTSPRVAEIQRKTRDDLAALKRTPANVAKLLAEHRNDAARIKKTNDLTPAAKARHLREVRETTVLRLASLVEEAEEARQNIEASAQRALAQPDTADPTEQLLQELQLQRAWNRTERLLAAGSTVAEVVARAAQERDAATFAALRAEISGHLLAKGAAASEIDATHGLIADHEDVVLPAEKLAAKTARKEAEQHAYFGDMALNQASEELAGGAQWNEVAGGPETIIPVTS
jgi:hypothetical protein